ncbi:MAG: hypothetical protein R2838_04155 [Caldilineaceae bacterium]
MGRTDQFLRIGAFAALKAGGKGKRPFKHAAAQLHGAVAGAQVALPLSL